MFDSNRNDSLNDFFLSFNLVSYLLTYFNALFCNLETWLKLKRATTCRAIFIEYNNKYVLGRGCYYHTPLQAKFNYSLKIGRRTAGKDITYTCKLARTFIGLLLDFTPWQRIQRCHSWESDSAVRTTVGSPIRQCGPQRGPRFGSVTLSAESESAVCPTAGTQFRQCGPQRRVGFGGVANSVESDSAHVPRSGITSETLLEIPVL
jgi:hypothetical protein